MSQDEAEPLKRMHAPPAVDGHVHLPTLKPQLNGEATAEVLARTDGSASRGPTDAASAPGDGVAGAVAVPVRAEELEAEVVAVLKTVYDPEIPVNIYELGLIYAVRVREDACVEIDMTLTAPACPVAGWLVEEVGRRVRTIEGVEDALVELVWDPPWTKDRMSEEAQLELGLI